MDEQLLHDRARKIIATVKDDAQAIVESGTNAKKRINAPVELMVLSGPRLLVADILAISLSKQEPLGRSPLLHNHVPK